MATNKITFQDLMDEFSAVTGRTKVFSRQFIKDVFGTIQEGLRKDEHVSIKGLGIFKLQEVPEREAVNPRTGKTTLIEAHKRIVFKPEKALREKVNVKYEKLTPKTLEKKPAAVPEKEAEPPQTAESKTKETPAETPVLLIKTNDNDTPKRSDEQAAPTTPPAREKKKDMPTFIIEEKKKKSAWRWILPFCLIILIFVILYIVPTKFDSLDNWRLNKNALPESVAAETDSKAPEGTAVKEVAERIFIEAPKPEPLDMKVPGKAPDPLPSAEPGPAYEENILIHVIKPGNTLWGISKLYYTRATLWPNIYRKNVERLSTPDLLIIGRELLVPELQGAAYQLTKEDSAHIAQGYYLAYQAYKKYDEQHAEAYLRVAKQFSTIRE